MVFWKLFWSIKVHNRCLGCNHHKDLGHPGMGQLEQDCKRLQMIINDISCFSLKLCLFWVKITSRNAFPEMRLFGWSGKFYFPEIEIRWPKKEAFDHGNALTLLFFLQSISGKWERERARARACERRRSSPRSRAPAPVRDRAVDRDLAVDRDRVVDHGAVVGLELARSTRTGARSSSAIVELTGSSPLARARALSPSLSHFPEMLWRKNRSVKAFPWSKAFFWGQRISISGK